MVVKMIQLEHSPEAFLLTAAQLFCHKIILAKSSSTLPRRTKNRFALNRFAFEAPPGVFCRRYKTLLVPARPV